MNDRIVITGMGWVTPLGYDLEGVWGRLLDGTSGIDRISRFDASTFPTTFAAQVRDYDHQSLVKHPDLHEDVGFNTSFALGAAAMAWRAAGLEAFADRGGLEPERLGIYLGSGEGSLDFDNYVASNLASWDEDRRAVDAGQWASIAGQRMKPRRELEQEPNMPAAHIAREFDVTVEEVFDYEPGN